MREVTARWLAIGLLCVLGLTALAGGWNLIVDPTGATMDLPVSLLRHSPFTSYFVPGVLLGTVLGVGSIVVAVAVLVRLRDASLLTVLQGIVTIIWIGVQVIMLRQVHLLHALYASVGIAVVVAGIVMWKGKAERGSRHRGKGAGLAG